MWRTRFVHSALLFALCFYLLLPAFGTAWHAVVPEHDHWLLHGTNLSVRAPQPDWSRLLETPCVRCVGSQSAETLVHALTPLAGLQLLSLLLGLSPLIWLCVPLGLPQRIIAPKLFLLSPPLVPPDPPPVA
ncbi:MAG: hypothetical protein LC737_06575 [Chloroflexi bacterium]|nr:hypothetical protein [Chloroflexota bacterium]